MIRNFNLARPYVKAIFSLALQQEKLQEWEKLLQLLALIVSQKNVKDVWQNREIDTAKKIEMLIYVFAEADISAPSEFVNLLRVLADKKRILISPQIADLYVQLKNEHQKTIKAKVVSAFKLDSEQLLRIKDFLERKFKNKIVLDNVVDANLIGGAVICAKDYVIDGSVKGQLIKMAEFL